MFTTFLFITIIINTLTDIFFHLIHLPAQVAIIDAARVICNNLHLSHCDDPFIWYTYDLLYDKSYNTATFIFFVELLLSSIGLICLGMIWRQNIHIPLEDPFLSVYIQIIYLSVSLAAGVSNTLITNDLCNSLAMNRTSTVKCEKFWLFSSFEGMYNSNLIMSRFIFYGYITCACIVGLAWIWNHCNSPNRNKSEDDRSSIYDVYFITYVLYPIDFILAMIQTMSTQTTNEIMCETNITSYYNISCLEAWPHASYDYTFDFAYHYSTTVFILMMCMSFITFLIWGGYWLKLWYRDILIGAYYDFTIIYYSFCRLLLWLMIISNIFSLINTAKITSDYFGTNGNLWLFDDYVTGYDTLKSLSIISIILFIIRLSWNIYVVICRNKCKSVPRQNYDEL